MATTTQMDRVSGYAPTMGALPNNLFVKQVQLDCCTRCCRWDAKTEFNIAAMETPEDDSYYGIEETGFLTRFFCGTNRPWTITVSTASGKG
jgi:hypothetical protein